jgi:hypothetical protein
VKYLALYDPQQIIAAPDTYIVPYWMTLSTR